MHSSSILIPLVLLASAPLAAAETIDVRRFDSIELRGGGSVVVSPGPVQQVTIVDGSSQFTSIGVDGRGKLRIDACNARCPRNYDLKIEIRSPDMPDSAVNGGGSIVAAPGFAPQGHVAAAVNGGGLVDVRALSASSVSAAVNGGGQVLTGHSTSLSAAVHGGGEVRYVSSGTVSSATHGGGTVRRGQ